MKVITIIITVISVCAAYDQESHFNNTLDVKEKVFHKIGEDILNTAKNIFKVFNPKKNLTNSPKIKMLLTMHNGLNKIIEMNYEIYDEIKNISKVTTGSKNISRYFGLNGLTAMLYMLRLHKFKDKSNLTLDITRKQVKHNISGDFKDENELVDFVNSFAVKLNRLSIDDLFKPTNESGDNKKQKLKYWFPETASEEQDQFNNITRRIYKGEPARANKYSFMASIHIDRKFACSGSLISLNLIITAASCLKLNENTKTSVVAHIGSDYLYKGGIFVPVVRVYVHPLFNPSNLRNNLAIMKMKQTSYDPKEIKRIKLHNDNTSIIPNDDKQVVVLGWGATLESKSLEPSEQLRTAKLDVYDLKDCTDMYSSQYVTERHFCAGFITKGGGACNKDIGGPGIINGILVGVISFGPVACGNPDEPTVFVRIGSYIPWISEIINQVAGSPEPKKTDQNLDKSHKISPVTKIPDMKTYYKKRQSAHRNARDEAISIVKEIINEIVLTSDNQLDETLYNDLYDDFNQLYLKSMKRNIVELDDSIEASRGNIHENSEYYDDPILNATTARNKNYSPITDPLVTRKSKILKAIPKTSTLGNIESDASTDGSDDEETSDNSEDEKGLNIDMPITKKPDVTYGTVTLVKVPNVTSGFFIDRNKIDRTSQRKTTDMWGLPKLMFLWNLEDDDKKQHRKPTTLSHEVNSQKRFVQSTQLRATSRSFKKTFNTQISRIGKAIYENDDDDKNNKGFRQREYTKQSKPVSHVQKPNKW